MKQIIDGRKYDTSTAQKLAEWDNEMFNSDLNLVMEDLYRKKTGEFFLYGRGGDRTKYRTARLIPLSEEEAKAWTEEKANDKYEEIFGEVEE